MSACRLIPSIAHHMKNGLDQYLINHLKNSSKLEGGVHWGGRVERRRTENEKREERGNCNGDIR